mmetsp:Transcript_37306/g.92846  ORF Transcript_37306/g.92846 Transcript_37306/m.92846 type:complete len:110 (-) Transcript_37306:9-338(-)
MSNLELFDCGMGDEGVLHLASALRANTTLTKLDLGYNEIGAVAAQHIAEALEVNATVTKLDLRSNAIDTVGAQHIAAAIKVNATVIEPGPLRQRDRRCRRAAHRGCPHG